MRLTPAARRLLTAAALSVTLLAAAPARAEGDDAETRFHKAYEAEVVDGKLAEAARVYLALMHDTSAPPRLRAESKFRFAVTAVLLGRSDEARAHLDELIADPATPATLRSRAREYLDATKGIGLGTELDRKLQELVFDLGRATDDAADPPVFRDFEILGKAAAPLLRKLLSHTDAALRAHAFRLLVRLDEPGMADAWNLEYARAGNQNMRWADLRRYMERRPDERDAFEAKLLALPDSDLSQVLGNQAAWWPASAGFFRAARSRGVTSILVALAASARTDPAVAALRREWLSDPDPKFAPFVADSFLSSTDMSTLADAEVVPLLDRMIEIFRPNPIWLVNSSQPTPQGAALTRLAARAPLAHLLGALESLVPGEIEWKPSDPIANGLFGLVAAGVEPREPSGADLDRYAAIVLRVAAGVADARRSDSEAAAHRQRVMWVLWKLPLEQAEAAAAQFLSIPGRESWAGVCGGGTGRPREIALVLAAARAAPPSMRAAVLQASALGSMGFPRGQPDDAERGLALIRVTPELLRLWSGVADRIAPPVTRFCGAATVVPADEARRALLASLDVLSAVALANQRSQATAQLLAGLNTQGAPDVYVRDVVLPVAPAIWEKLRPTERPLLLSAMVSLALADGRDAETSRAATDMIRAHPEALNATAVTALAKAPDGPPLESWLPGANPFLVASAFQGVGQLPDDTASAILARLAPSTSGATPAVRAWLRVCASPKVRTEFHDRLLREAPFEVASVLLDEAIARKVPEQLSADALAALCRRALEPGASPPAGCLANAVTLWTRSSPSADAVPAIRALLASTAKFDVQAGITAATLVGREELLPALVLALDMPDPAIRASAKRAIDQIVEERKLRDASRDGATEER